VGKEEGGEGVGEKVAPNTVRPTSRDAPGLLYRQAPIKGGWGEGPSGKWNQSKRRKRPVFLKKHRETRDLGGAKKK